MDLFSQKTSVENLKRPLAERIRPKNFEDLLLTEDVRQKLSFLKQGVFSISFVLYGPPGVGKTSVMKVAEEKAKKDYICLWLNAVDLSVKELRESCSKAREFFLIQGKKTIFFIDEIHRLSKAQQDVMLPSIESGEVVLIGATTEKPLSVLNRPLLSRLRVIKFAGVGFSSMESISKRAVKDLGFKNVSAFIEEDSMKALISFSMGDGRKLIGLFESLYEQVKNFPIKTSDLSLISTDERAVPMSSTQFKVENTSALIKSMRGSDLEASLLYLVRLVEGGVDPIYIYRRFLVFASEDIGNADKEALIFVQNSKIAFESIGMPEGYYGLVQTATYLARAPKSRESVDFLKKAKEASWSTMQESPPEHLLIKGSGAKSGQNLPKSNRYGFLGQKSN